MPVAVIATVHVYAVGGSVVLASKVSYCKVDNKPLLEHLRHHTLLFILLTVVFGANTGVWIWWTIGLSSPLATESLIHINVFGWAMEYVLLVLEIVSAFMFPYYWGGLDPGVRKIVRWIYEVYAYSLCVRNGKSMGSSPVAGWISSVAFVFIGLLFANKFSSMANPRNWIHLFETSNVAGAAKGTSLNAADPILVPRWLMMLGLAVTTTAVSIAFDAVLLAEGDAGRLSKVVRRVCVPALRNRDSLFRSYGELVLLRYTGKGNACRNHAVPFCNVLFRFDCNIPGFRSYNPLHTTESSQERGSASCLGPPGGGIGPQRREQAVGAEHLDIQVRKCAGSAGQHSVEPDGCFLSFVRYRSRDSGMDYCGDCCCRKRNG